MPVEFETDPECRWILFRATGTCGIGDVMAAVRRAQASPAHHPGVSILWDFRDFDPSGFEPDWLQQIVAFNKRQTSHRGAGRSAFVASEDLQFGMLRMFQGHADGLPAHFRVFRDYDEAVGWLGGAVTDARGVEPVNE